jgi:hypothetical protein
MTNNLSYVTLAGFPLSIELRWPFHKSTSGGDFNVLHGVVTLADGSELHANVSLHLSAAVQELLPSLEPKDTAAIVINALRKWTDKKELEFLKSTKLQPLPLSSRFLYFRSKQWHFEDASDDQIFQLLKDQLYWNSYRQDGKAIPITDPVDLMYTGAPAERFHSAAQKLVAEGWATVAGDNLVPTGKIAQAAAEFDARASAAFEALKQKHAFEASKVAR